MNDICIEMFPARCGDCFLVRLSNGRNIVVDMGYKDTYINFFKDRLVQLKEEGQCIDLLIITHIDEDHIEGAIEFIKENGDVKNPKIIEVKEVWHNSYRHLQFKKEKVDKISNEENVILKNIINNEKKDVNLNKEYDSVSAIQGSTLAGYLYKYGYLDNVWNKSFNSSPVNLDYKNTVYLDDVKLRIVSPNTNKLRRLSKFWYKELKRSKLDFNLSDEEIFDDAYEIYMKNLIDDVEQEEYQGVSYNKKKPKSLEEIIQEEITQKSKDNSKSNGASIAFILEYKRKKVLFLGDAHEDIVINEIKEEEIFKVNAIKVSHHGSIKNNYDWIDSIKSDSYLISTNGEKHSHPDNEFIAKLILSNNDRKKLHFNYSIGVCLELEDLSIKKDWGYIIETGDGYTPIKVSI
ncbi:Zn-dependent hydrolase [[Clostridium] sordellii]|uniref:MBL fold metallo-hydrolase n=1 Tax=Paraclostridium sordellii TaxID=1505 RepID=UPI0005DEEDC9|nr:MBL fold metallo-hydrolase [Paeniclostridium sordellii]CEP99114.1 Zn-dependent hydrolase [[Clostridium] sordellii] [Paeniclostridium sordellii]